jgi:deazaflavin-dependent oxidoreductase (nitroreductase family)
MVVSPSRIAAVWREQGSVRNWFHTKAGARFLNHMTAWFRISAPRGYAVLTTVGRRTGAPRRSNVRSISSGNCAFIVAIAGQTNDWSHNLHDNPEARLRIGRRNRACRARPPRGEAERLAAQAAYCDTLNWFDYFSSIVNQRGIPSPRRMREMHARWIDEGELFVMEFIADA